MHMSIEYEPLSRGAVPVGLACKLRGREGPEYAEVAWDGSDVKSMLVDGSVHMFAVPVKINGSSGLEPYVMQGASLLSIRTSAGGPVQVNAVKFSRDPGGSGFFLDGPPPAGKFPAVFSSASDPPGLLRYLDKQGLFCTDEGAHGGMYAAWLDRDVTWDMVRRFLERHPGDWPGAFCGTVRKDPATGLEGRAMCCLFPDRAAAGTALARWLEQDRAASEKGG